MVRVIRVAFDRPFGFLAVDRSSRLLLFAGWLENPSRLCIDQLHRLLRVVGERHVHGEEILDEAGKPRLVFRTPNWEDFVHLTCTEIRHCGAGSVQVVRRLRSMLENLMQTLPPHRHAELRQQLGLLDRVIDGQYAFPEDRTIARIPDPQGLGGALGVQPAPEAPTTEGEARKRRA
jgi:predicted membrane protein DUF2254